MGGREEEAKKMMRKKMEKMEKRMKEKKKRKGREMEEFNRVQESEPTDMKEGRAFRLCWRDGHGDWTGRTSNSNHAHNTKGKGSAGLCRCPPRQGTSYRMAGRQVPWVSFNLPDFSGCRAGEHTSKSAGAGLVSHKDRSGMVYSVWDCIEKEWQEPHNQRQVDADAVRI
ncbi:hypothetical protein TWF718_008724 [Orbilia javanica]|uniref:Uncharacterized protein n=1 Tax=Orbilia javanica TaxID=47235 RepID=A0AAN8MUS3_9PEZI